MTTEARTEVEEVRALVAQSGSKMLRQYQERMIEQRAEATQMMALLTRQGPQWLDKATPGAVLAFCRVAAAMHLNPLMGEVYLIHGGPHIGIAGRRVIARRTMVVLHDGRRVSSFHHESPQPRLPSQEERELYDVHDGDVARVVSVFRRDEVTGEAVEYIGCGIVRRGEFEAASKNVDRDTGVPYRPIGNQPAYMAEKRAFAQAYKRAWPEVDIPSIEEAPAYDIDGEFTDVPPADDDADAAPADGPGEQPDGLRRPSGDGDEAAEAPGQPTEASGSNAPEPPRPLPVTDLRSLIGWAHDTHGWDGNQVAHALGGSVAGDIAKLVREKHEDSYPKAAEALAEVWAIEDAEPHPERKLL